MLLGLIALTECAPSSVAIVFQNGVSGLEIEDPHNAGSFIPVAPVPYAMTMNIGDSLQRWSNGSWIFHFDPKLSAV